MVTESVAGIRNVNKGMWRNLGTRKSKYGEICGGRNVGAGMERDEEELRVRSRRKRDERKG